jgi:hypothetical protein
MVAFVSRKSIRNTEPSVSGRPQRLLVLGPPLLLEGEDAAAYDEFLARICAAVKPADIIEEMFIADIVSLEWEVLRWRRLKWTLVRETGLKALEHFLVRQLKSNYALHEEHFKSYLAEILQNKLPTELADSAEMLAAECAPNNEEADDKLDQVLSSIGLNTNTVLNDARADKAKELVQECLRGERDVVSLIDELFTDAGVSMDTFMTKALRKKIDDIEQIDRLIAIAETRRNVSLREIDRRRAVLGETLRRSVQEIEDGELVIADGELVIEPTAAEGKNAA